jgi:two-component system response regulator PhoP
MPAFGPADLHCRHLDEQVYTGETGVPNSAPAEDGGSVRVLVVEDHSGLAKNVARALRESAGYAVDLSGDGQDGLFMAQTNPYDLILLDLMLPKMDGLAVLKTLRGGNIETPVLILTSRDDKETTVALLDAGADDYLTKPFDIAELVARSRALIRRAHGRATPVIELGDLSIHTEEMTVTRAGRAIALTAMEYRLLEYMAHRPRAVLSKTDLLDHLYDHNWEKFSNVLEVYVSSLRRKLNTAESEPLIHTLKGRGYVLTQPGQ